MGSPRPPRMLVSHCKAPLPIPLSNLIVFPANRLLSCNLASPRPPLKCCLQQEPWGERVKACRLLPNKDGVTSERDQTREASARSARLACSLPYMMAPSSVLDVSLPALMVLSPWQHSGGGRGTRTGPQERKRLSAERAGGTNRASPSLISLRT